MAKDIKDIVWVAGLLEGEGSFGWQNTPTVRIGMADLDVIEKYRKIVLPSKKIEIKNHAIQKHYLTQYVVRIHGSIAIQWMMTIYSFMGIRRRTKIREVIGQWKEMLGTGNHKNHQSAGHPKNYGAIKAIQISRGISWKEASEILEGLLNPKETIQ